MIWDGRGHWGRGGGFALLTHPPPPALRETAGVSPFAGDGHRPLTLRLKSRWQKIFRRFTRDGRINHSELAARNIRLATWRPVVHPPPPPTAQSVYH